MRPSSHNKMPKPGEHKTVQARILKYAQEVGWSYVSRTEAECRRGFDDSAPTAEEKAQPATLYFGELLHQQIRKFNPQYKAAEGALLGEWAHLNRDITGNRDFLGALRNETKYYDDENRRELDLIVIDYGDATRAKEDWRNVYEVTEEWVVNNGTYGTREDVVFLINGIPVLVIECKNASKDEAIALGVDQIRRYHVRDPGGHGPEMLFTATEAIGFTYGVTWSLSRRHLFNWKHQRDRQPGIEGQELLRCSPGSSVPEGLHHLCGEGGGASEAHSPPASDDGHSLAVVARALGPNRISGA